MSEVGVGVVVDSTVLIYLSKIDRLSLLDESFSEVVVPEAVHDEVVVEGLEHGYSDALAVDEAEFLYVEEATEATEATEERVQKLRSSANLGRGECEAIAVALDETREDVDYFLSDDRSARKTAESLGVEVGGTIYVLLRSLKRDVISLGKYEKSLERLADTDFRMRASLYRRAVEEGRRLSEGS